MVMGACWNIRGLNDTSKQKEVRNFVKKNGIAFVGLLETRVLLLNKEKVAQGLVKGWKCVSNHKDSLLGRIWVLWNPGLVNFRVTAISHQAIHGELSWAEYSFWVSVVYGDCNYISRRELWEGLEAQAMQFSAKPWIICGDFNVSRYPHEHSGRRGIVSNAMKEFECCIHECELEDIKQSGRVFTWNNKMLGKDFLAKKLDRVIGNWHCFNSTSHLTAHFSAPGISDHSPVVIQFHNQDSTLRRNFKS
ncbi:Exo_endo_phos domain-containing protein [Cephalotus follicularis]|uniref:Exo_endo_phos domain-containing protein n=1 Tax=Cephalotus follicularis TaxID=3775 RepID=A0A1Q3CB93_CEPFO|nr:Exo_endo_phos domain-containing protein [Cephalotus follicularis]